MSYIKTIWIDEKTPLNAENMNHIEEGIENISRKSIGSKILLEFNTADGILNLKLLDENDVILSQSSVDLPTEKIITNVSLDYPNKKLIFTLADGSKIDCNISALIDELDNKSDATNLENGTGTKALVQKESETFTLNGVTYNVDATGKGAAAFGGKTAATGSRAFASGSSSAATGAYSHTEGANTLASGNQSHAEGNQTIASGTSSHAEGVSNEASNIASHAEGQNNTSSGVASHSEGQNNTASATNSHAEGLRNESSGQSSHSEGEDNYAQSTSGHVEGKSNIVSSTAVQAHAEGWKNNVRGNSSHVEGAKNYIGENSKDSHVSGSFNISNYSNQTVVGTVNDNKEDTLFEVGNGEVLVDPETITYNETNPAKVSRSNAFEVYKDGTTKLNGNLEVNKEVLLHDGYIIAAGSGFALVQRIPSNYRGYGILIARKNGISFTYFANGTEIHDSRIHIDCEAGMISLQDSSRLVDAFGNPLITDGTKLYKHIISGTEGDAIVIISKLSTPITDFSFHNLWAYTKNNSINSYSLYATQSIGMVFFDNDVFKIYTYYFYGGTTPIVREIEIQTLELDTVTEL